MSRLTTGKKGEEYFRLRCTLCEVGSPILEFNTSLRPSLKSKTVVVRTRTLESFQSIVDLRSQKGIHSTLVFTTDGESSTTLLIYS